MVPMQISKAKINRILNRRINRAKKRGPQGYSFFLFGLRLSLTHGASPGYVLAQMQSPHWPLYVNSQRPR
jgi:hypothetical protein